MGEHYSLWQMGQSGNRFSSMTPHKYPEAQSLDLGTFSAVSQAFSTIAQFGMWYEIHQMNKLAKAQFEERRLGWLDDVVNQWIEEHRHTKGIRLDVTKSLSRESTELLDKLVRLGDLDVPQVLLLKVNRVADFLDKVSAFWAGALERLIVASGSSRALIIEAHSSSALVKSALDELDEVEKSRLKKLAGGSGALAVAFGLAAPVTLATMTVTAYKRYSHEKTMSRLEKFPELSRIEFAVDQVVTIAAAVDEFFNAQKSLPEEVHLYGVAVGKSKVKLMLGAEKARKKPPVIDLVPVT